MFAGLLATSVISGPLVFQHVLRGQLPWQACRDVQCAAALHASAGYVARHSLLLLTRIFIVILRRRWALPTSRALNPRDAGDAFKKNK
jgi:hypothetical protein